MKLLRILPLFIIPFSYTVVASQNVTLDIPPTPPEGHQVVDGNYQSYSIEFSYMQDYAGNDWSPNLFSRQLLQNLLDISGALPIIRAGGTTSNRAVFYPNQTEAVILTFDHPGEDQPNKMTIGPTWMESFRQFPNGTQYIYGLNFNDGNSGLAQTVLEATNAYHGINRGLYAYEIGNEVNGFPGTSRRPANYSLQDYVNQWLEYGEAIRHAATEHGSYHDQEVLFQGCAFEAPRDLSMNSSVWNVANAVRDGLVRDGTLRTVADHDYMGSNCPGSTAPTLKGNLLNHHRMTSLMYYHQVLGNEVTAMGVPYVIGETNSISCQGIHGISDVFGAAIWSVDYVLYVAGLNVSRIYFHQGTPYRYSAWQPVTVNDTEAYVKPLYYGNLFTSTALAGGDKIVRTILNETSLTAYAIYRASPRWGPRWGSRRETQLESIAVVNLEPFYQGTPASERPYTTFVLPEGIVQTNRAVVRRMTAPGVDSEDMITFAGRSVDSNGHLVGTEHTERIHGNCVRVGAGEAVLISISQTSQWW